MGSVNLGSMLIITLSLYELDKKYPAIMEELRESEKEEICDICKGQSRMQGCNYPVLCLLFILCNSPCPLSTIKGIKKGRAYSSSLC